MPVINEADAVNYGGKVDNNLKTKPRGGEPICGTENRNSPCRELVPPCREPLRQKYTIKS